MMPHVSYRELEVWTGTTVISGADAQAALQAEHEQKVLGQMAVHDALESFGADHVLLMVSYIERDPDGARTFIKNWTEVKADLGRDPRQRG